MRSAAKTGLRALAVLALTVSAVSVAPGGATAAPTDSNGSFQIGTFAGKCLDVWGAGTNDGAGIDQWTCNGQANQRFTIVPGNDGYEIHTFAGKCLDVWGAGTNDGAGIIQWTCTGSPNQEFTFVPRPNHQTDIRTFAGKCLDVWDANVNDGVNIIQWICTGRPNQQFTLS
ncbi:RICIN domain-containing protein [Streptomyces sp. Y1]|uniref:RICIN domain-containing protein n=1 Tax=Streptomyces sp. Y1 TaxID=3238634 RepID=A0AB39TX44_9ACTN